MRKLGRFLYGLLAVIGFLSLLGLVLLIVSLARLVPESKPLPQHMLLSLEVAGEVREQPSASPLDDVGGGASVVLSQVSEALARAEEDERVGGLVLRIGATSMSLAQAQELRDALQSFRSRGKKVTAFAESLDDFGIGGGVSYYLAAAADEVWLQPSGSVGLTGISLEQPFAREALDSLGVAFEVSRRMEYKTAMDFLTEKEFTAANREAFEALGISWLSQMVAGIAESRGLEPQQARALVDRGPFLAKEALDAKLVDRLGYRDEMWDTAEAAARDILGGKAKRVSIGSYLSRLEPRSNKQRKVAMIHAVGPIVPGRSPDGPFAGGSEMVSSITLAEAIEEAVEDDAIEAILLRIDSPGGSYTASDTIWRAVVKARDSGKPVVASMGSVAASGGYFIAMAADKVVAQPGTITGSIGVIAGKPVLSEMWDSVGVNWGRVDAGARASMWSPNKSFSEAEWQRMQTFLDAIYTDFVTKAAKGRGMTVETMQAVAKGRIWSGADARRRGLVDELGGLAKAESLIRQLINVQADEHIDLVPFPAPDPWVQFLNNMFGAGHGTVVQQTAGGLAWLGGPEARRQAETLRTLEATLEPVKPLLHSLNPQRLDPRAGALRTPLPPALDGAGSPRPQGPGG